MITCHEVEATWKDLEDIKICSYCGSLEPGIFLDYLKNPSNKVSGSDWKYGWPHKFYISVQQHMFKFYNIHLIEPSIPKELFKLIEERFQIVFIPIDGKLHYKAPAVGYQYYDL